MSQAHTFFQASIAGAQFHFAGDQDFVNICGVLTVLGLLDQAVDARGEFGGRHEPLWIDCNEEMAIVRSPRAAVQLVATVVGAKARTAEDARKNFQHQSQAVSLVSPDRHAWPGGES